MEDPRSFFFFFVISLSLSLYGGAHLLLSFSFCIGFFPFFSFLLLANHGWKTFKEFSFYFFFKLKKKTKIGVESTIFFHNLFFIISLKSVFMTHYV